MQPVAVHNPAASVAAAVLVIGGGVVLGALVVRSLMNLAQAAPVTTLPAQPQCPAGTVWSTHAQRCIPQLQAGEKPVPPPPPAPAEDDWGLQMTPSSQALLGGLAVRLFGDHEGKWHFAYSWRADRGASGIIAQYLADDPDEDTLLIMSHADSPALAYQEAINWVEKRLIPFIRETAIPTGIPPSVVAGGPLMYERRAPERWAIVVPAVRDVEGVEGMRYWDYNEPEYAAVTQSGTTYVTGCCYDHNEAWAEALRYL